MGVRLMKMFLDTGKRSVNGNEAINISLSEALDFIDKQPSDVEYDGNFIGFENNQDETIQFIRFDDGWMLDVPIIQNGEYIHSEQDMDLDTYRVKEIRKRLFIGENWRSLCTLKIS